jgi:hypothetical protein
MRKLTSYWKEKRTSQVASTLQSVRNSLSVAIKSGPVKQRSHIYRRENSLSVGRKVSQGRAVPNQSTR